MLTVMLVDDEPSVLTSLQYLINWAEHGAKICGAFHDPCTALAALETLKPDLIITDIEMPEISGLELLVCIQKLSPDTVCTILTAYDDFSYAQQAISLGVFRYLLKPLSSEALLQLIHDVQEKKGRHTRLDPSVLRSLIIREAILHGLSLRYDIPDTYSIENKPMKLAIVYPQLPDAHIQRISFDPCISAVFRESNWTVLMLEGSCSAEAVEATLKENCKTTVFLASPDFLGTESGHRIYKAMVSDIQEKIFWYPAQKQPDSPSTDLLDNFCSMLLRAIYDPEEKSLINALSQIQSRIILCAYHFSRQKTVRLYADILEYIYNLLQEDESRHANIDTLYSYLTCRKLHEFVASEICAVAGNAGSTARNQQTIRAVKAYVQEHYSDPAFRLSNISTALYLNNSYLSHLFRIETGITLFQYLLDIRMQQAKILLEQSELSISAIAQQVGYPSTKNFYNAFKKYYKESPRNYQKRFLHSDAEEDL